MQAKSHRLLERLESLESGEGLRRAKLIGRVLFVVGLVLAIFVGIAIALGLHPVFIALPALAVGWIIAERNAIRLRTAQWPIFRDYIDWKRVREDLNRDA
jgi:hypothetical protein